MKINVLVKNKSKKEDIEKVSDDTYIVRINVPPIEGKANERIIELLAKYFDCPKSQVVLTRGAKSKNKGFTL